MIQLVYISSATTLFSGDDLIQLLTQSRANNRRRNITGMLLYKGGNFLQVLEGENPEVAALIQIIEKDTRHHGIIRLYQKDLVDRDFPDWSMGFHDLGGDEGKNYPGFSDFMNPQSDLRSVKPNAAAKLLSLFKTNLR